MNKKQALLLDLKARYTLKDGSQITQLNSNAPLLNKQTQKQCMLYLFQLRRSNQKWNTDINQTLKQFSSQKFSSIVPINQVIATQVNQKKSTLFIIKPLQSQYISLKQAISSKYKINIKFVFQKLVNILSSLYKKDYSHNNINLKSIFINQGKKTLKIDIPFLPQILKCRSYQASRERLQSIYCDPHIRRKGPSFPFAGSSDKWALGMVMLQILLNQDLQHLKGQNLCQSQQLQPYVNKIQNDSFKSIVRELLKSSSELTLQHIEQKIKEGTEIKNNRSQKKCVLRIPLFGKNINSFINSRQYELEKYQQSKQSFGLFNNQSSKSSLIFQNFLQKTKIIAENFQNKAILLQIIHKQSIVIDETWSVFLTRANIRPIYQAHLSIARLVQILQKSNYNNFRLTRSGFLEFYVAEQDIKNTKQQKQTWLAQNRQSFDGKYGFQRSLGTIKAGKNGKQYNGFLVDRQIMITTSDAFVDKQTNVQNLNYQFKLQFQPYQQNKTYKGNKFNYSGRAKNENIEEIKQNIGIFFPNKQISIPKYMHILSQFSEFGMDRRIHQCNLSLNYHYQIDKGVLFRDQVTFKQNHMSWNKFKSQPGQPLMLRMSTKKATCIGICIGNNQALIFSAQISGKLFGWIELNRNHTKNKNNQQESLWQNNEFRISRVDQYQIQQKQLPTYKKCKLYFSSSDPDQNQFTGNYKLDFKYFLQRKKIILAAIFAEQTGWDKNKQFNKRVRNFQYAKSCFQHIFGLKNERISRINYQIEALKRRFDKQIRQKDITARLVNKTKTDMKVQQNLKESENVSS